ncbi:cytosine permease [Gelria sp. Kuro-4]|uniref:cytosine permease n=1 Tax=Gelria sp. Kuro-4 TaxID=2796927 RepID=UPI001BEEA3B8|nr:cytosine permease [Gelria sp. Kuro-4]BCV24341.1 cytosine permease [Gelria sp. Kuro-4]
MPKSNCVRDEDFALAPVPAEKKRGFWSVLAVMLGFTFFSASMWAGGTLGTSFRLWPDLVLVVLGGNLILGLYTGLLGDVAAGTNLSTHLLARYAFGRRGSALASFLLAATQIGWFGVGVAMFALPIYKATGWNLYLLLALAGALMTSTAYVGYKAMEILSFIAVPAIALLGSFSVSRAVEAAGGIGALAGLAPQNALSVAAALTMVVGSFASGGTLTPDFVRYARTRRTGVAATIIAFLIGNSLMFFFGAAGAAVTGKADISEVLMLQGLLGPAVLLLGLNIWTTNDNALYASGLGLSSITGFPKKKIVLVSGVLGTLFSLWLNNNFVSWLVLLGSILPPIGGVILADYYLVHGGKYPALSDVDLPDVNWTALAAWAGGVALARLVPWLPPLAGILGAALLHTFLAPLAGRGCVRPAGHTAGHESA